MRFDPVPAAKRLRKLHRAGRISHATYAVGDALLWSCRAPGRDEAQISYDRLAKLAGVGRSTATEAVKRLRALGVLSWRKTRLRVAWALGVASRQGRNVYRLFAAPITESGQQSIDSKQVSKKARSEVGTARPGPLSAALAALGKKILEESRE
jgi:hypothetical protein